LPETQAPVPQQDILRAIVATKRLEVEALGRRRRELCARAADMPPARPFAASLSDDGETVALVAEVKRRSPGAGDIRPALDPAALARGYADAGARAVSVLTDGRYFGGSLADLTAVRRAVDLPVLRKDFTISPLQVHEARAGGADAVLLIVRILDDRALVELLGVAAELALSALVEVHDQAELERAVVAGASLIGINNRDLDTFRTDLAVTEGLLARVPAGVTVVSESGIRDAADVERLGAAGVDAVLVGETLLRAPDPGARAAALAGRARMSRNEATRA
jgi:indole-3-glycerol phosphate synthase